PPARHKRALAVRVLDCRLDQHVFNAPPAPIDRHLEDTRAVSQGADGDRRRVGGKELARGVQDGAANALRSATGPNTRMGGRLRHGSHYCNFSYFKSAAASCRRQSATAQTVIPSNVQDSRI